MVNTYGALSTTAGKNPHTQPVSQTSTVPTLTDPVAISAKLVQGQTKNRKNLVINADILKGWHIYAYVSKDQPFIQTETVLELPEGIQSDREWQSSAGISYPGDEGIFVYEGNVTFSVGIDCSGAKAGSVIKCGLYYQACDINKCFPPKKKIVYLEYNPGT
jgi:hypothetical protein